MGLFYQCVREILKQYTGMITFRPILVLCIYYLYCLCSYFPYEGRLKLAL